MNKSRKISITSQSVISRNPEMLASHIDDEVVMMSIENSEYYGLNSIGSRIWELIEKPVPLSSLIDRLLEEFEVGPDQCENDVKAFLLELHKKKLVMIE